ncbi:Hypothetical_protein [Hexamita inflata]|uniref:Hypothetical_protein n=1 Tax=Hexamita inflata TaxID=28002 RepID=A0AA86UBR3_9EUKA|nr:Hypothetical protein HINF_LOCUS33751 [Hexamita inflata]
MKQILLNSLAGSRLSCFLIPRSQLIMQIYFWETCWNCFGQHHSELQDRLRVIEANVTNNSISGKENILKYQFHSELEKVRSLNKTSQLELYAGPYSVYSHIIQIDLAHFQQPQQTKLDLKNNSKQVSPVSSVYNYIPTMTLFAHANLTEENTQENYQNGQQTYFHYAMNNVI